MEHYLGTLKHPRHTKFTRPDTKMSELDESFADIRLDKGIETLIEQPLEIDAPNEATEQPQE